MIKNKNYKDIKEFQSIVFHIKHNPAFLETKKHKHHGADNTVYSHSLSTAYFVFKTCKLLHLNNKIIKSATIAALLHDFFGYDWRTAEHIKDLKGLNRIKGMHAFNHGYLAIQNASKYYFLTEYQKDAILKHMFPIYPIPPKHIEGWLVTFADKIIALQEIANTTYIFSKSLFKKPKKLKLSNA